MSRQYFLLLIFCSLIGCSSFSEAGKVLRNEKVKSTDEFLVKKKEPLELPPNYGELPIPNSNIRKEKTTNQKINKILKLPKVQDNKNKTTTIEEAILDKIN
jgi:hypothetical protein|tara:strand:+ start:3213 stop:3515 length:303 start_codon:yes stop_codon:yes gene_type:complete